MRKQLYRITALLLILACFCSSAFAEEQAVLSLGLKRDGEVYSVSVRISGNTEPEMLQFCLRYDDEKLELKSVSAGDALLGMPAPTISDNEPGYVYFVWDALKPLSDGILMELSFSVRESADGSTSIYFDKEYETIAADSDYNEIVLNTGKVDILIGILESENEAGDTDLSEEVQTSVVPKESEIKAESTPENSQPMDQQKEDGSIVRTIITIILSIIVIIIVFFSWISQHNNSM